MPWRLQVFTRNAQHQTQAGFCNIVQFVIALWRYFEHGVVPEGAVLKNGASAAA
jgi:hypothetical protein